MNVEDAYREHWTRLLASLAAEFGLDTAEEALGEAYARACEHWPEQPPGNPAGWLRTVARRAALDRLRRAGVAARKLPLLAEGEPQAGPVGIADDRLRLMFTCCHPALALPVRIGLTLRYVTGLPTRTVARLFLVGEATMAQRLTRARRKITEAGIGYRVPEGPQLPERLAGVLHVVYLVFTEGYRPGGDTALATEGVRLARLVRELMPGEPETAALLALVMLQHARRDARRDARRAGGGEVLLPDQDRTRWHTGEIEEALGLLERAGMGRYALEARIAAAHATAARAHDTDWDLIAALYARLEEITGSAMVRLNRAVAVAEASGPAAGLGLLEGLELPGQAMLPAVRAELTARLGELAAADVLYAAALELSGEEHQRAWLLTRRALNAARRSAGGS
ncbi:RNA polymerase subunit sigma-24 [Actinorhabdospora filicis]|uniref:RNA polymerase subunit sigma-24 n=1 Tax=Actinorhabdospora filicis TaxID=1785913 RepID=A0A9W6SMZ6_9ACTN|nr:DUF6596 domain-containing protein [Actinorhabdospora filicis]GLZ78819.1 RNA polymerase subunit sigma-24 [Actinorhabdospora filicis]